MNKILYPKHTTSPVLKRLHDEAWQSYFESELYIVAQIKLQASGVSYHYVDEVLREAFDFAWNTKLPNVIMK